MPLYFYDRQDLILNMNYSPYRAAAEGFARSSCVRGIFVALFLSQSALADGLPGESAEASSFELDPALIDSLQFSRVEDNDLQLSDDYDLRTEVSFKLRPTMPKFNREGAYGLNMFGTPTMEIRQSTQRDLFFGEALPDLHDGLSYSAGVRIEHNDETIDSTAFVSSSLLGVSYGRLGKVWYGGVDVNLEQFSDEINGTSKDDVVSLDFTTGRRLGFTGLDAASPLWLLSLQGNFDINDEESSNQLEDSGDWFLNPSLFWQRPGFTFSAQVQVPMQEETFNDDAPDYRLRAIFEKQF